MNIMNIFIALSKFDADTQCSDADYPRKHADELGIDFDYIL